MNSSSMTNEATSSNHDISFFLDRQIQNKLLEIDDQLWVTDYMVESKGHTEVKVPKTIKVSKSDDVAGWFSSSKCVLRKPEKEKQIQQPPNTYSWREQARLKNLIQNSFVFKHYPLPQSYIEQYREENSQLSGTKSPIVREPTVNDLKRVGLQNTVPPATQNSSAYCSQNVCNHCNQPNQTNLSNTQNLITAAFNYTRRETTSVTNGACNIHPNSSPSTGSHICSKHNHHSHKDITTQAYKYKLSREAIMHNIAWRCDSEHSIEHDKEIKTPRVLSGKRSAGKPPTKVTVPSLPNGQSKNVQTVTVQQISQGKPVSDGATVATTQQNLRALDALTCVAAEKQLPEKPESNSGNSDNSPEPRVSSGEMKDLPGEELMTSDDCSDVLSLSKLSTTCLGADMKTKGNEGLELACALHAFPNDHIMFKNAMRVLNAGTLVWHPSSSVSTGVTGKPKKEFTLHNPSPTFSLKTPDISKHKTISRQEPRSKSETRFDFPTIRAESRSGMLVSDINLSNQANIKNENNGTSSSVDTKPPFTQKGNIMKSLRRKYVGYIRTKQLHKSKSDPSFVTLPKPSPPTTDKKQTYSVKPYPTEVNNFQDNMKMTPVYTLWSTEDRNKNLLSAGRRKVLGEDSVQKVAEYILNEHYVASSPVDVKMKQDIAVANGVVYLLSQSLMFTMEST